jgi:hypothetical protein
VAIYLLDEHGEPVLDPSGRPVHAAHCQHGKWRRADIPHSGWTWSSEFGGPVFDADEKRGDGLRRPDQWPVCEMCEKQRIIYVHVLEHPDEFDALRVGIECAKHLTGDHERAVALERALDRNQKLAIEIKREQRRKPTLSRSHRRRRKMPDDRGMARPIRRRFRSGRRRRAFARRARACVVHRSGTLQCPLMTQTGHMKPSFTKAQGHVAVARSKSSSDQKTGG